MGCVSSLEDLAPSGLDEQGPAVVDLGGGVEADPGVAVLVVVPGEGTPAEAVGVFEAAETAPETGPVLEGAEMGPLSTSCRWSSGGGCGSW